MFRLYFSGLALLMIVLSAAAVAAAEDSLNAGFVSGVWYSKRPIFAEDNVRIYAALQNRSGFDLKGKIKFFDNDRLIGEADFSALAGRLIESWTDWRATPGQHSLYALVDQAQKSEPGKSWAAAVLLFNSSARDNFFVEEKKEAKISSGGISVGDNPLFQKAVEITEGLIGQDLDDSNAFPAAIQAADRAIEKARETLSRADKILDSGRQELKIKRQELEQKLTAIKSGPDAWGAITSRLLAAVGLILDSQPLFYLAVLGAGFLALKLIRFLLQKL
jgi:hypothetical protein